MIVPGTPSAASAELFIYDTDADVDPSNADNDDAEEPLIDEPSLADGAYRSMYVILFEEMLLAVLQSEERNLFSREELSCFDRYEKLSYSAQYLLIRMCLRKTDQWFKLDDLSRYKSHLGDQIQLAMQELCSPRSVKVEMSSLEPQFKVKKEEPEGCIGLTTDQENIGPRSSTVSAISRPIEPLKPLVSNSQRHADYSTFADDHYHADLRALLECLDTPKLKTLARTMHVLKKETRRDDLINILITKTSTQSTLPFVTKTSTRKDKKQQGTLFNFVLKPKPPTQQDVLRNHALSSLKACMKLNADVVQLFRRVNIVYFRSTQYSPKLLTQAILSRCKKRVYDDVPYERTDCIWKSRDALLRYEAALALEAEIDDIWGNSASASARARSRSVASKTPAPLTKNNRISSASPVKRRKVDSAVNTADDGVIPEADSVSMIGDDGGEPNEPFRIECAKKVKAIFESVYPEWKELVATNGQEEPRGEGLERFHHGHILTRIVCKGSHALGLLHEYEREAGILDELLAQSRWRRGRRGRWHERKALILMTHVPKGRDADEAARTAVIEALRDTDTHIIYRPKLVRRLITLEKRLNVPRECRIMSSGTLTSAPETYIEGVRIHTIVDAAGKFTTVTSTQAKRAKEEPNQAKLSFIPPETKGEPAKAKSPLSGKSIWRGRNGEEVTVEIFALEHYESLGFRGFHCEGRIITTIFGLLFWDIIFATVPGAFETAFQVAPLDIGEDTFYTAREELFLARFAEIKAGKAVQILSDTFDLHRPAKTTCVGVRWDLFERDHLVGIVKCLDPAGLSAICQVVAEDYVNRTAGVPDLILWNEAESTCKFVEVKGPGDSLQENQKIWTSVLLQAGIDVEICHVTEVDKDSPKKRKAAKAVSTTPKKRKRKVLEETAPESEDEADTALKVDDPTEDVPSTPTRSPESHRRAVEVLLTPHSMLRQQAAEESQREYSPEL